MRPHLADRPLLTAVRAALKPLTNTTIVVGVSGGPDSLCLLHLLTRVAPKARVTLHVAHLDHALRPESPEDARFVEQIAVEWGLPVTVDRRVPSKPSEEVARHTRYAFLSDVGKATGASAVAVGHTADDQAETVLMHLIRGSGLTGLAGMSPDTELNGLRVIRPLLAIHRAQTHTYCERHGIPYRDDPSNRSPKFTRNRVRSEVLPVLRQLNPRVDEALLRLAAAAQDEEDFWRWFLAQDRLRSLFPVISRAQGRRGQGRAHRGAVLSRRPEPAEGLSKETSATEPQAVALRGLPRAAQTRLLQEAYRRLSNKSLEATHLESLQAGKRTDLPGNIRAETESGQIVFGTAPAEAWPATPLNVPGETIAGPWKVTCTVVTTTKARPRFGCLLPISSQPLSLRPRGPGDRYRPTGMPAPKKLQDILVDAKVPRRLRDLVPILEGPAGILWAGAHRIAEEAKLTADTHTALELRVEPLTKAAQDLCRLYTSDRH